MQGLGSNMKDTAVGTNKYLTMSDEEQSKEVQKTIRREKISAGIRYTIS